MGVVSGFEPEIVLAVGAAQVPMVVVFKVLGGARTELLQCRQQDFGNASVLGAEFGHAGDFGGEEGAVD